MKKRYRGRHLAAGRRREPRELIRGDCGSRRKLAAACRKVSRRAVVARRKRNVFRKIRTQGKCGTRKELAAAGRRMTQSAKEVRRRGQDRNRYDQDSVVQETREETLEGPECNNGIRDRGFRQQLRGNNRIKNQGTRRQLLLKIKRISEVFDRKTFGLEFVKRAIGMSSGLRKMGNWTLWRRRPPPERSRTGHCGGLDPLQNGRKPC
jgi:hypothetical protein